jgi:hypothetical protein
MTSAMAMAMYAESHTPPINELVVTIEDPWVKSKIGNWTNVATDANQRMS